MNIKITTGILERQGKLTRPQRNKLLPTMTDDVASLVLAHNYDQTLALSLLEMDAAGELEPHARFMSDLEHAGRLDRAVEGLPDAARRSPSGRQGRPGPVAPRTGRAAGLWQAGAEARDRRKPRRRGPVLRDAARGLLPEAAPQYKDAIRAHRLRPDIIATVIANDMINRCGPSFPTRTMTSANCDVVALVTGYEAAKQALDFDARWAAVEALDLKIPRAGRWPCSAA